MYKLQWLSTLQEFHAASESMLLPQISKPLFMHVPDLVVHYSIHTQIFQLTPNLLSTCKGLDDHKELWYYSVLNWVGSLSRCLFVSCDYLILLCQEYKCIFYHVGFLLVVQIVIRMLPGELILNQISGTQLPSNVSGYQAWNIILNLLSSIFS